MLEHHGCLLLTLEEAAGCEPPTLLMVIVFEPPGDRHEGATAARPAAAQQTDLLSAFRLVRYEARLLLAATDVGPQLASPPQCYQPRVGGLCLPSANSLAKGADFDGRDAAMTEGADSNGRP